MLFDTINQHISSFATHSLSDLSKALLMDRVDTKYIIPINELRGFLDDLRDVCTVLAIDGRKISHYQNSYFDSDGLRYYHDHHNGALSRYKVRCRTYTEQSDSYLEVKLKNNKGRTIKRRVSISHESPDMLTLHSPFLKHCGVTEIEQLIKTQDCDYHRIAFANESAGERLTIDCNISYSDPLSQQQLMLNDLAVIELKQNYFDRDSALYKIIRKHQYRACNFSKYCIGLSLLRSNTLKTNRFKETLLKMKKITIGSQLSTGYQNG